MLTTIFTASKTMERKEVPTIKRFIERFNYLETSRNHECSKCTMLCRGVGNHGGDGISIQNDQWYGTQNFNCLKCRKFFCYE